MVTVVKCCQCEFRLCVCEFVNGLDLEDTVDVGTVDTAHHGINATPGSASDQGDSGLSGLSRLSWGHGWHRFALGS